MLVFVSRVGGILKYKGDRCEDVHDGAQQDYRDAQAQGNRGQGVRGYLVRQGEGVHVQEGVWAGVISMISLFVFVSGKGGIVDKSQGDG